MAASLARMHLHAPTTDQTPDPWYCESMTQKAWDLLVEEGADAWWATVVAGLVAELADAPRPQHSAAQICHLDVCPVNTFLCNGQLTIID